MHIRNKRVLVTGADGFIGSHLTERLSREGCRVRALVFYNSFNSYGWLDMLDRKKLNRVEIIPGDIRDPHCAREILKDIDIVFHLAALIGIPYSYSCPDMYVATNISGTLNILQAARIYNLEKVLVTSTSEVYGTAQYVPIDELHPRQPQSPYSATKIGADSIAESFYRSFKLPVVIVRPFNTYGPRQSARAIIPTIISQLLNKKTKIRLGSTYPTRDFVYVKDVTEAFIAIAKSNRAIGEEINIATQKEISIGDIGQKLINMINPKAKITIDKTRVRPENSEVERLLGSCEKISRLTGWRPRYSLDRGLKETVEWFKKDKYLKLYKPDIYNV